MKKIILVILTLFLFNVNAWAGSLDFGAFVGKAHDTQDWVDGEVYGVMVTATAEPVAVSLFGQNKDNEDLLGVSVGHKLDSFTYGVGVHEGYLNKVIDISGVGVETDDSSIGFHVFAEVKDNNVFARMAYAWDSFELTNTRCDKVKKSFKCDIGREEVDTEEVWLWFGVYF